MAKSTIRAAPLKRQPKMKAHTRKIREAYLIVAGALFFPLLCIECWWINLAAIALLGGAALLNPEYIH